MKREQFLHSGAVKMLPNEETAPEVCYFKVNTLCGGFLPDGENLDDKANAALNPNRTAIVDRHKV